jgi:hypothetical protein
VSNNGYNSFETVRIAEPQVQTTVLPTITIPIQQQSSQVGKGQLVTSTVRPLTTSRVIIPNATVPLIQSTVGVQPK